MTAPTNADLVDRLSSGATLTYLPFWGHRPRPDGSIGPGCLSQWWPAAFTVDTRVYPTAEHWMMWSKAELFGDHEIAREVLATPDPGRAKALGRGVRGFDDDVWREHRYSVVVAGNLAKFSQHDDLRWFLLGTRDRVLVEASPVDPIWGIGLAATDPRAGDPAQWRGLNLLGYALMRVRDLLREGPGPAT